MPYGVAVDDGEEGAIECDGIGVELPLWEGGPDEDIRDQAHGDRSHGPTHTPDHRCLEEEEEELPLAHG